MVPKAPITELSPARARRAASGSRRSAEVRLQVRLQVAGLFPSIGVVWLRGWGCAARPEVGLSRTDGGATTRPGKRDASTCTGLHGPPPDHDVAVPRKHQHVQVDWATKTDYEFFWQVRACRVVEPREPVFLRVRMQQGCVAGGCWPTSSMGCAHCSPRQGGCPPFVSICCCHRMHGVSPTNLTRTRPPPHTAAKTGGRPRAHPLPSGSAAAAAPLRGEREGRTCAAAQLPVETRSSMARGAH
jgi:hypothetical protein